MGAKGIIGKAIAPMERSYGWHRQPRLAKRP